MTESRAVVLGPTKRTTINGRRMPRGEEKEELDQACKIYPYKHTDTRAKLFFFFLWIVRHEGRSRLTDGGQ